MIHITEVTSAMASTKLIKCPNCKAINTYHSISPISCERCSMILPVFDELMNEAGVDIGHSVEYHIGSLRV